MAEWDNELGIWKGSMAIGDCQLPNPLYLFGYGSLLWNPGVLLESFPSYPCTAQGFSRVFAQRSCDHRGVPAFPGAVVTLIDNAELDSIIEQDPSIWRGVRNPECGGLVWLIPADKAQELVSELDFREKGGYCKRRITIRLHSATEHHASGDIVDAIVYIGSISNPLFDISSHRLVLGCSRVADIIATAVGPSGPNYEYLFGLEKFLLLNDLPDEYIFSLSQDVRSRLGYWRGLHTQNYFHSSCHRKRFLLPTGSRLSLLGCGSNEHSQIGAFCENQSDSKFGEGLHTTVTHICDISGCDSIPISICCGGRLSAILNADGLLSIWGDVASLNLSQLLSPSDVQKLPEQCSCCTIQDVTSCSIGYDHVLLKFRNGLVYGLGSNTFEQCTSASNPVYFLAQNRLLRLCGNDDGTIQFTCELGYVAFEPKDCPLKVVAAVQYSAAITETVLWSWGKAACCVNDLDTTATARCSSWQCSDGTKLIDVACGNKHTAVLDQLGRIWTFGDNKFGSLGPRSVVSPISVMSCPSDSNPAPRCRDLTPKMVDTGFSDVRWCQVVCGWYHTVVRGVDPSGQIHFFCFGRNSFGQISGIEAPSISNQDQSSSNVHGQLLPGPPTGGKWEWVWSGSEYVVAVDADTGLLWARGWNDHGNLGIGHLATTVDRWEPMLALSNDKSSSQQLSLHHGFGVSTARCLEGALACGGSHCIFLL